MYEERHQEHYIPLREYLLENLDKTIMIAQDGVNYLVEKYPVYKEKVILSRLGTMDQGLAILPQSMDEFLTCQLFYGLSYKTNTSYCGGISPN